jgi:hypothetical protein
MFDVGIGVKAADIATDAHDDVGRLLGEQAELTFALSKTLLDRAFVQRDFDMALDLVFLKRLDDVAVGVAGFCPLQLCLIRMRRH